MRSTWSAAALAAATWLSLLHTGCVPELQREPREPDTKVPGRFVGGSGSATNSTQLPVRQFFSDPQLAGLIDLALENNQELNLAALEVDVARYEILAREGEYLPKVRLGAGAGIERVGEDTSQGRSDEAHDVKADLPDYLAGVFATWEVDIWRKLRNARDAAAKRYLSTLEGRRFLVTSLVAELADSYYELMALDNQREVLLQNVAIQEQALEVVRLQKQVGRVTELAVKRFEAEVLKNRSRQYTIQQQILETENRINFLVGRYPQRIARNWRSFMVQSPSPVSTGVPSQLLANRPDVKQAELELEAAKLDVEVARARFYPSLELNAGVALRSFELETFPKTPMSLAYLALAELSQPLWNRRELTAGYYTANSKQLQAVVGYEQTILRAFNEVSNELMMLRNMEASYDLRSQEVERLEESIAISSDLFRSARADYMEVLLTRRDALDAQMELIETKRKQMGAMVKLYRALGGGWR